MAIVWMAATATTDVVVKPVANMYSRPAEDADVVSQAIYGSNVGVLEEQAGWVKVRTPDDYTGWVPLGSLKHLRPGEGPYASAGRVAQVESLFANLYREPDVTRRQPLLTVPFETKLEVIAEPESEQGRWLEVRLPDDRSGWLQRGDVAFEPRRLNIPELIAFSKRFLGLPYFWGGVSTFGFDCSGFTQMLCRRRGSLIPRDASVQARWPGFAPVERAALKPGDLLFFGQSPQKITHTGMYLGDGKFINATTHEQPMVRIDELDDPYWTRLFAAARRLE